jgi:hypothetical protein
MGHWEETPTFRLIFVSGHTRKSGDAIATSDLPLTADIKRTSMEMSKPSAQTVEGLRAVEACG